MTRQGSRGYMSVPDQMRHFAGCIYVLSDNKVRVPDGDLLNRSRFNATYGGYLFLLDGEGRKTTPSAWQAFTQNRVYRAPKCHAVCSRSDQPSGAFIHEEGRVLLNVAPTCGKRRDG